MASDDSSGAVVLLDQFERWIDASLSLGISGWGREHCRRGELLRERLSSAGLRQLAEALAAVLGERPTPRALGRLVVIHEITREAVLLSRPWPGGSSAKEENA